MELSFNFTQKTFSINFVLALQTLLSVTDSWHSLKAVTEVFKRFSSQVALDFPDSSAHWHAGERAAWLCSVTAGPQLSLAVGVGAKRALVHIPPRWPSSQRRLWQYRAALLLHNARCILSVAISIITRHVKAMWDKFHCSLSELTWRFLTILRS